MERSGAVEEQNEEQTVGKMKRRKKLSRRRENQEVTGDRSEAGEGVNGIVRVSLC